MKQKQNQKAKSKPPNKETKKLSSPLLPFIHPFILKAPLPSHIINHTYWLKAIIKPGILSPKSQWEKCLLCNYKELC